MTKVRKKATKKPSTEAHRESITEDTEAFLKAGYKGAISYECFAPEIHALSEPFADLKASFEFIASELQAQPA